MRLQRNLVLFAAVAILPLQAQFTRTFEATSVKRNLSGTAGSDSNTTTGRLSLINVTTLSLILRAFGVQNSQVISAPDWVAAERYDVIAVTGGPDALTDKQRQPFIAAMLAERWNLRFHKETRTLRVYSLVPSKNGTKLVQHSGPGEYAMKREFADGHMVLRSTRGNIGRLVEILSGLTDSLVIDSTGLSGEYDFTLEWAQDQNADAAAGPSLFTALQEQLGLRLESAKKPVETIVIDHIERPSEN